ncbi:MAG: hypothetical protein K2N40_01245 [Ureaplasma sp.]|nr:hypothetical protein [Ureaplasma sp.]
MCKFIGIESVIANAFIEIMSTENGKLSLKKIEKYGYEVVNSIEEKNGERVILIFEKSSLKRFFINYSDYFTFTQENGEEYIQVKENVDLFDLKEMFRWTLPIEMIQAFKEKRDMLL